MQPERSQTIVANGATRAPKPGVAEPRRIEACDPRADGRRRVVLVARDRVVIARSVGGVFMHIAMTPDAFRGVVLRLCDLRDNVFRYEVRLAHRDPDLCVTLFEASDDSEIQAEWRLWARFLGLPALVEREEGRAELEGPQSSQTAQARRRGKTMLSRRPRFLARRKTGRVKEDSKALPKTREMFPGSKEDR